MGVAAQARKFAGRNSFAVMTWGRTSHLWSRHRTQKTHIRYVGQSPIAKLTFMIFHVEAYKAWEAAGAAPKEFKEEDRPVAQLGVCTPWERSHSFCDALSDFFFWRVCRWIQVSQEKEVEIPDPFSFEASRTNVLSRKASQFAQGLPESQWREIGGWWICESPWTRSSWQGGIGELEYWRC